MDIVNSMRMFIKIAELNSFARAAESLDMAVPRISRACGARGTSGDSFDPENHAQDVADGSRPTLSGPVPPDPGDLDETYLMLAANAVSTTGRLRVVAPALFAIRKLPPVLTAYQRAYPNIVVELVLADRPVDLIEEEFDLGILAARRVTGESLVSRRLTSTDLNTCSAPA